MANNARVGITSGAAGTFPYKLIGEKWSKNGLKMQFLCQKCFKWPIIWIYGVFWWFLLISKIFLDFYRKLPNFWAKNTRFFADAAKIWKNNFQRKVYAFFQKWSNWPNLWYKCTLGYPLEKYVWIFWYFEFQPF